MSSGRRPGRTGSGGGGSRPYTLGETYNVRLGETFLAGESAVYHTIAYDFKPASVTQQTATLSLSEDDSHVTVSHGGDASVQPTIFEGPRKDCTNECVLIFDPETNTFVLERIASSVSVKRVRGAAATAAVSKRPNAANGKGASLAAAKRAARPSTPAAAQSSKSPKVSAPTDKALDRPAAAEGNSRAVSKSPVPPAPAATSRPTSAASLRSGPSEPYESSSGSESTEDEGVAEFKARIARKRASANSTPVSDGGPQSGKRARMPSPSDSNRLLSVDEIHQDLDLSSSEDEAGDN